ncbi:MAG: hypothetical protein WCQ23_07420 [Candidatus Methanomethylophilaceae archaeon]
MSRYPFTDCLNEYMPLEYGHISSSTYATTRRKLVQLGKIFHELKQDGRVSTTTPARSPPRTSTPSWDTARPTASWMLRSSRTWAS